MDDVSTFSKDLRIRLKDVLGISPLTEALRRESADGTIKVLAACPDGERVESVYIPAADGRRTVCISVQTGCALGCAFCATGASGPGRDLGVAEIAGQVFEMLARVGPVTNVVFMGMGEPLLNLDASLAAFAIINDPKCAGIGRRRITISTVGIPVGIKRLKESGTAVRLAVSLHSAVDRTRRMLVPGVDASPAEVVAAALDYAAFSKQRLSFECVLIDGVNDDTAHAETLAGMLVGNDCRVNLIPYNPVEGLEFKRPSREKVKAFRDVLASKWVNATIRTEFGADIDAACGQLRAKEKKS